MRYGAWIILSFIPLAFAKELTHCPSVAQIQRGDFAGWLPLTIDGEELASQAAVSLFKTHVQTWQQAKWSTNFLEYAHCFYQGDNDIVAQITFAHDAFAPQPTPQWVWQTTKEARCNESLDSCRYLF